MTSEVLGRDVLLTKFGDPSSNRLTTIQNAADGRTDGQTDMLEEEPILCIVHCMHCISELKTANIIQKNFFAQVYKNGKDELIN